MEIAEQREKAELYADIIYEVDGEDKQKKVDEIYDESGKPFWMKFIKQDYLNDSSQNINDVNKEDKNDIKNDPKYQRAMKKIREQDTRLAQYNKM